MKNLPVVPNFGMVIGLGAIIRSYMSSVFVKIKMLLKIGCIEGKGSEGKLMVDAS